MRKALIIGVTGQDGAYLARHLGEDGYRLWGTTRGLRPAAPGNLDRLGVADRVTVLTADLAEPGVAAALVEQVEPDEIYNLGAQSSVGRSFAEPLATTRSIIDATANVLEAIRLSGRPIRYYGAGSSEVFGDNNGRPSNEETPLRPRSPYGAAKCAALWQVLTYRESYRMFAVTGILFNHESPLRPPEFVTTKIVETARAIAEGRADAIRLGEVDIVRDWGWAPEYVSAMALMLRMDAPRDLVVATGHAMTLRQFAEHAFGYFGLSLDRHLVQDPALMRPNELNYTCGDPRRAAAELGWRARLRGERLVRTLCEAAERRAADAR